MQNTTVQWKLDEVRSPHLDHAVSVVVARDIPYVANANRLQNLSIYLFPTPETTRLVGSPASSLPGSSPSDGLPRWHVHIHGGAWRDPQLSSTSIEPAVAHAFSTSTTSPPPITAIASLNYTLSPYPTHPTLPYDSIKDNHSDPGRDARHPDHVRDVLSGFALLRSFGLTDDSYILSGHSCGACLCFQSILQSPEHFGLEGVADAPRPAAMLGLNGLYDLPGLVHDLGESHAWLADEYRMFQGISFGEDEKGWPAVSPALFEVKDLQRRMGEGKLPRLVVLDQSDKDQLVPMNQTEKLEARLKSVDGIRVVRGNRCVGEHAAPWKEGYMIWESIRDVLKLLKE